MYYNEKNTKGGLITTLLIRLLFIILFILILVWLFPTKNALNPLYQGVFRDNLDSMKEAAESYFTNDRLPSEIGDTAKMTLSEMLSENLILPFVDKNGNSCDLDKSYVEIKKTETEYELKVNLSCSSEEAFIIEHMGCNNKCAALGQSTCTCNCNCSSCGIPTGETKTIKEYEFKKEVENKLIIGYNCPEGYTLQGTTCKKEVTTTDTTKAIPVYESSTSTNIVGYRCDVGYVLDEVNKLCKKSNTLTHTPTTNYKDETITINSTPTYVGTTDTISSTPTYTDKITTINSTPTTTTQTNYLYKYMKEVTTTKIVEDTNQPIRHYTYDNVINYYTKNVCTSYNYFIDQTSGALYQSGTWTYQSTQTMTSIPNDTPTTKYEVIGMDYDVCYDTCTLHPYYKVRIYTRTSSQISNSAYANLSVTCNVEATRVPVYGLKIEFAGFVSNKITTTETLTQWAPTWNDATLLSQNYGYVNIRKANGTTSVTTYTCPSGYDISSDKKTCSKVDKVQTGATCPTGYNISSDKKTCTKYTNTIVGYTCPAGYTKSSDEKTCSKTTQVISGYTCPTGYNYDSIANTCKKTDTITANAIPVYESLTTDKIVGYRCNSGYTLNSNNTCSKQTTEILSKDATALYKTTYGIEYMWSTQTQIAGWTRTGNERTRTIAVTTESDNSNKQK